MPRRFLRRPNVSEANEAFSRLSRRLRDDDEPAYEALCQLAVARCEQSVGNGPAEAEALVAASRSFLRAEEKVRGVGCPSFEEHLAAAIHSYNHAIRLMEETQQVEQLEYVRPLNSRWQSRNMNYMMDGYLFWLGDLMTLVSTLLYELGKYFSI